METELILPATGGGNQNLDTPARPLSLYLLRKNGRSLNRTQIDLSVCN